jgi:hypothetical protein
VCFSLTFLALVAVLILTLPVYTYSRRWGYMPAVGVALVMVLILVLWWIAFLPVWFAPQGRGPMGE